MSGVNLRFFFIRQLFIFPFKNFILAMSDSIRMINSKIAALDTSYKYPSVASAKPGIFSKTVDRIANIFQTRIIFGSFDINPLNHVFATPDLDAINGRYPAEEIPQFNFSVANKNEQSINTEKLSGITKEKCTHFSKSAASYHFSWFLYEIVCGIDPTKEQKSIIPIYLKIVREANAAKKGIFNNYLFIFLRNLGEKLSLFQKLKVIIVYLILGDVLEDAIEELSTKITTNIMNKYSNREDLSIALKAILKRLHSFFSDYQNTAIRYVNGRKLASTDNSLEGNFNDFLMKEMQTKSFLRAEDQKGYTEEKLRNEFANILSKHLPKINLARMRLKKIGLNDWNPNSYSEASIKALFQIPYGILQALLIIPYSIIDLTLNLYIKHKLVGVSLFFYKKQGVIQRAIQSFTDKGWNDSYRKTFDKLLYEQLSEIDKKSTTSSNMTSIRSMIDEETRELIHGLVQSLVSALDINSTKMDNWKKIESAINYRLSDGFVDRLLDLDKKARCGMERSIEEGLIKLCDFLTQDNMLKYLIDNSLSSLNSLYEDESQTFNSSTRNQVVSLTKKIIHPSVRESVRATLGNGPKIAQAEGQKFYDRIKIHYAPKLTSIRSHIEYIISNHLVTEESIHATMQGLLEFRYLLFDKEFHDFKSQYFSEFKILAKEIPKQLQPAVNLQNTVFQYLKKSSQILKKRLSFNAAEKSLQELVSLFFVQKSFKTKLESLLKSEKFFSKSFLNEINALNAQRVNIKNEINTLSVTAKYIEKNLNIHNRFTEISLLLFLKKQKLKTQYFLVRLKYSILHKIREASGPFRAALENLIEADPKDLQKYELEFQKQADRLRESILIKRQNKLEKLTELEAKLHRLLEKEIKHNRYKQKQLEKDYTATLKKASGCLYSMENQILRLKTKNVTTKNNFCFFAAVSYLGLDAKLYDIIKINKLFDILKNNSIAARSLEILNSLSQVHQIKTITQRVKQFAGNYDSIKDRLPAFATTSFQTLNNSLLSSLFFQAGKIFFLAKCLGLVGNLLANGFADYFVTPKLEKRVHSAFSFISDNQTFRGLVNSFLLLNVELIER